LEPDTTISLLRPTQVDVSPLELVQGVQNASREPLKNHLTDCEGFPDSESISANDNFPSSSNIDWAFLNMLEGADDRLYAMNTDFRDFLGNGLELIFSQSSDD
jgi:hypothetical protein